jgi:hypothetical protein
MQYIWFLDIGLVNKYKEAARRSDRRPKVVIPQNIKNYTQISGYNTDIFLYIFIAN